MIMEPDFLALIQGRADQRVLFLPHAVRQMSHPDRMISTTEIQIVIHGGEIIEDYPEDTRGHSALLAGKNSCDRIIHVVCSPKEDYLAIITAYIPDSDAWSDDYKVRKPK